MAKQSWRGALGRRLLLQLLLFSGGLTLLMTAVVLWSDYRKELGLRDSALYQIEHGYLPSLAQSLWKYDDQQILSQLDGILNFPFVVCAAVDSGESLRLQRGEAGQGPDFADYRFPLLYRQGEREYSLGELRVTLDNRLIYENVYERTMVILASQFIRALLISAFILLLVNRLITRHLRRMATWADGSDIHESLALARPQANDELERVTQAINYMRRQILRAMEQRDDALQELGEVNAGLERRIDQRTVELSQAVTELNTMLAELKDTQQQLVESEKMAQLGGLVAGVAHELNTPLGICVTARSYIEDSLALIRERMKDGTLDRRSFSELLNSITEGLMMIDENLNRSHRLVRTFKSLAVDRTSDYRSEFSLRELLQDVSGGGDSFDIDGSECVISTSAPAELKALSCRNTLHTILGALIGNSIDHGYPQGGDIHIQITVTADQALNQMTIDYRDDGAGIAPEVREHIFEPFFTTGRQRGKTGLGMHLVYNLVTHILAGDIRVMASDEGAWMQMVIPLDLNLHDVQRQSRNLKLVAGGHQ